LFTDVLRNPTGHLWVIGGIASIVIIVLILAIVTNANSNKPDAIAAATATAQQVEVIANSATSSATPETHPSATASLTATLLPTTTAIQATELPATATSKGIQPSATAIPTDTPTHTPIPTERATSTAQSAAPTSNSALDPNLPVILTYNSQSLILLNRSRVAVDVSNLTFIQINSQGNTLDFNSSRWNAGNSPTNALAQGQCFQVGRDDLPNLDTPANCDSRQAWSRVSPLHWFWISDDPMAKFEVKRGDRILVICQISVGECAFDPNSGS
jgi:hypothetical protein